MKRGLVAAWVDDGVLEIKKARGKLTIDEIEDVLMYGRDVGGMELHGYYALIFKCNEDRCGGNGLYGNPNEDPLGDVVQLKLLYDSDTCPVCDDLLPPFQYCPHCGEKWKFDSKHQSPDGVGGEI